ncbi:MAG: restriction endonuclease, partial [Rhodobacterales bacterium 17-64-5]
FSGGERHFPECRFATFVRDMDELNDPAKVFTMGLDHFRLVNPNSMTAPVYKASRDRQIATALYERLPVLVNRSDGIEVKTWPVKYVRMYDMANDSNQFRTVEELQEKEGAWPEGGGRWRSGAGVWVPLFEGKMVQAFDHRASGITTVAGNLYRSGQAAAISDEQRHDPDHVAASRYYVLDKGHLNIELAIKDVTSTTNSRSLIACLIPPVGAGHTLPLLRLEISDALERAKAQAILAATLNSTVVDFVARTKILSNHASWYVLEQLPVAPPELFQNTVFGKRTAAEIVCSAVLELTYTCRDMAPFAADLGHLDERGELLPPFVWDDARRQMLRAKLDAVFFHLYGITDRDDIRYIYSTALHG